MAQYTIGDKKKFDKKTFTLADIHFRKADADKTANKFRDTGVGRFLKGKFKLVRVQKTGRVLSHAHLYLIWVR
jgi:hypothetical protein